LGLELGKLLMTCSTPNESNNLEGVLFLKKKIGFNVQKYRLDFT